MAVIKVDITIRDGRASENERASENGFPDAYLGIEEEIRGLVRRRIEAALVLCDGNKSAAARLLGLTSYQTLTNWMAKHGVSR